MNMNLRNCPECGRLFAYQGRNLCSQCQKVEEDQYTVVRKYVRDNPGATVFEVAEETGVAEERILTFLREGRLHSKGMAQVLTCDRCGKFIASGRYCPTCVGELDAQIREAVPARYKPEPEYLKRSRERMHIKDGGEK